MKNPKIVEWEIILDGIHYTFSYQRVNRQHMITVNGIPNIVKGGFTSTLLDFDEAFGFIGGRKARLVIKRGQPDVAVNGRFLRSGKKYISRPMWAVVFAFICLALPLITIGGAIPAILGLGGAMLCIAVSKTTMPSAIRVLFCVIITLAVWFVWLFVTGALGLFLLLL